MRALTPDGGETNASMISWRDDAYGNQNRALYAGDIYVGDVSHYPRNSDHSADSWTAMIMTNEDGETLGWFATEQEAKDALRQAVLAALHD